MTKVKMLTLFVVLVIQLLLVSPATAFDVILGQLWIEFGGPLGVPPVVLQLSASAPFDEPSMTPAECSLGANYTDCATALREGIEGSFDDVDGKTTFALESQVLLVPGKEAKKNWVVGSSWTATFCCIPSGD